MYHYFLPFFPLSSASSTAAHSALRYPFTAFRAISSRAACSSSAGAPTSTERASDLPSEPGAALKTSADARRSTLDASRTATFEGLRRYALSVGVISEFAEGVSCV